VLTERARAIAAEMEARVETETRARLDQVDAAADQKLDELDAYVAEARRKADDEAQRVVAEAQTRVDELAERERILQGRVAEAQAELRSIVARFVGEGTTIDLTDTDPVVAFEGTYHDGVDDDYLDDDLFPDLHDDEAPASDVRLEWNKPDWARPSRAIPVSQ
jgi:hypothetical protein